MTSCFRLHRRAPEKCTSAEELSAQQQERLPGLEGACASAADDLERFKKELAAKQGALEDVEAQLATAHAHLQEASRSKVGSCGLPACAMRCLAVLCDGFHGAVATRVSLPAHKRGRNFSDSRRLPVWPLPFL